MGSKQKIISKCKAGQFYIIGYFNMNRVRGLLEAFVLQESCKYVHTCLKLIVALPPSITKW